MILMIVPTLIKLQTSSCVHSFSRLLRHDVSAGKWTVVMDDVSYASYSVIAPDPRTSTVAIGNISGWLRLLACQSQGSSLKYVILCLHFILCVILCLLLLLLLQ